MKIIVISYAYFTFSSTYILSPLLMPISILMFFMAAISGLPTCKLANFIENRVNCYLKKKDSGAGEVTIRVVSCTEKLVEVKPGMKMR